MAGFSVVHGSPQTIWVPVEAADTCYVGQIVCVDLSTLGSNAADTGVSPLNVAVGASSTTNKDRPLGIVIGTNNKTPVYNSTYKTQYITAGSLTASHTSPATESSWFGVEGPWSKGDNIAMVKIAVITPSTVIRGPIFAGSYGTALDIYTATAGDTNGKYVTTNATQLTPDEGLCTVYCRTGANAGIYRITDNTSTTKIEFDHAMPYDTAIGDTFVLVGIRSHGVSYINFDTESMYIEGDTSPTTTYYVIHTLRLDLSEKGKEYCEFMFDGDNFCTVRA